MRSMMMTLAILLAASLGQGCAGDRPAQQAGSTPVETLPFGEHDCPHCGEMVDEVRYGGELVTAGGDTVRFRSAECLAGYLLEEGIDRGSVRSLKVVDFNHGRRLIPAETAVYVHSQYRSSPHGLNLLALPADNPELAFNVNFAWGGEILTWEEVLDLVRREWQLAEVGGGH